MAAGGDTKALNEMELVHCLETLSGLQVTIENLRNPSPQFMESIFECVMRDMMIDINAVRQMPWQANMMMDNKEIYEDALPFITFFTIARQIMEKAGITDFSIKDLQEPKRKRTKKILTFLVVLWKHVLLKLGRYKEIEKQCLEENNYKGKLRDELDVLQKKYQDVVKLKASANKQDYLKEKVQKEDILSHYIKQRDEFQKKYRNLKAELVQKQKEINDLDLKIVSSQEKLEELQSRILPSPSRLDAEIEELKKSVAEVDTKILDVQKNVKEKCQEKEILRSKLESIDQTLSDITQVIETLQLFREEVLSVCELQKLYSGKMAEVKKKKANLEMMEEKFRTYEQKKVKSQLQHKTQMEHYKKMLSMSMQHVEKENNALKLLQLEAKRFQKVSNQLAADIESLQMDKKLVMDKAMEEIAPFQQRVLAYIQECSKDADGAIEEMEKLGRQFDENKKD